MRGSRGGSLAGNDTTGTDDGNRKDFDYNGNWGQCLDRIADGLPNLADFGFDHGSPWGYSDKPQYGVGHRKNCGARMFPQRYIIFDHGILPTHWPEAEDDGSMHDRLNDDEEVPKNWHTDNLEVDQKALDRLLTKLRST